MRTRSLTVALAAAATAALVGACADGPVDPGPTPSPGFTTSPLLPTGTPAPPGQPTLPPPVPPVSPPQPPPTDRAGLATITGEVYAGVEPNCVLLRTDGGDFLLFGAAAEQVQMGSVTTLRGYPQPDMASTCQQGMPFEVTEVVD